MAKGLPTLTILWAILDLKVLIPYIWPLAS